MITHKMKKMKGCESWDRLSELPDSVLLVILSLLPMKDVVETSLLSKRFKDLWVTVPCLYFKSDVNDTDENDGYKDVDGKIRYHNTRFPNFVNRALLLWRGTKILEFKVEIFSYEWPPFINLDVWLRIAMENEVEKLYVNLLTDWDPSEYKEEFTEYCPPQRLYSCSSIRELYLAGCQLKIYGNIQWDQLKYLKIYGASLSEHVMNQILSGSPQLEVLSLSVAEINLRLNIHSSSLKVLKIEIFESEREIPYWGDCVLTIWAPNVETLEILGDPYGKYVMENLSSITNTTVDINIKGSDPDDDFKDFSGYLLLEDFMEKAYAANRHVEKVTLSGWCSKMLGEMQYSEEDRVFEQLSNAKILKLYNCHVYALKDLLKIFHKLTKLVFFRSKSNYQGIHQISWSTKDPSIPKFDTDKNWRLKARKRSLRSCLLHLRTVEIVWNRHGGLMFDNVEFLLKNASKLEKLVIQVDESVQNAPEYRLIWVERLLQIPRLSPTAEVILCRK